MNFFFLHAIFISMFKIVFSKVFTLHFSTIKILKKYFYNAFLQQLLTVMTGIRSFNAVKHAKFPAGKAEIFLNNETKQI